MASATLQVQSAIPHSQIPYDIAASQPLAHRITRPWLIGHSACTSPFTIVAKPRQWGCSRLVRVWKLDLCCFMISSKGSCFRSAGNEAQRTH